MSAAYDVIVIGAGHNGLTTATFLARAGRSVLVVERGGELGGLASSYEFHPGYRSAGLLQDTGGVRRGIRGRSWRQDKSRRAGDIRHV